jgi:hypothetical protein
MGFWCPGPQPANTTSVLGVGFDPGYLKRFFATVRLLSRLSNHLQVNNDEQLAPLWFASGPRERWPHVWPKLKNPGEPTRQHPRLTATHAALRGHA